MTELFDIWTGFDPVPDGFINITDFDRTTIQPFRLLYGIAQRPFSAWFLAFIHR